MPTCTIFDLVDCSTPKDTNKIWVCDGKICAKRNQEQGYTKHFCFQCIGSDTTLQVMGTIEQLSSCAYNVENIPQEPVILEYNPTQDQTLRDISTLFTDNAAERCGPFDSCSVRDEDCNEMTYSSPISFSNEPPFTLIAKRDVKAGVPLQTFCIQCSRGSDDHRLTLQLRQKPSCADATLSQAFDSRTIMYALDPKENLIFNVEDLVINSAEADCPILVVSLMADQLCYSPLPAATNARLDPETLAVYVKQDEPLGWAETVFICVMTSGKQEAFEVQLKQVKNCENTLVYEESLEIVTDNKDEDGYRNIINDFRTWFTNEPDCGSIDSCQLFEKDCETMFPEVIDGSFAKLRMQHGVALQGYFVKDVGWIQEACIECSTQDGRKANTGPISVRKQSSCAHALVPKEDTIETILFSEEPDFTEIASWSKYYTTYNKEMCPVSCQAMQFDYSSEELECSGYQPTQFIKLTGEQKVQLRQNIPDGFSLNVCFKCATDDQEVITKLTLIQEPDCSSRYQPKDVPKTVLEFDESEETPWGTALASEDIFRQTDDGCSLRSCSLCTGDCQEEYAGDKFQLNEHIEVLAKKNVEDGYSASVMVQCQLGNFNLVSNLIEVTQKRNCGKLNAYTSAQIVDYDPEGKPEQVSLYSILAPYYADECPVTCVPVLNDYVTVTYSMITVKSNVEAGYETTVDINCYSQGKTIIVTITLRVTQQKNCGVLSEAEDAVKVFQIPYDESEDANKTIINLKNLIKQTEEERCPLELCLLKGTTCDGTFQHNNEHLYLYFQSFELQAWRDVLAGYTESACIQCFNGQDSIEFSIEVTQLKSCSVAEFSPISKSPITKELAYKDSTSLASLGNAADLFSYEEHCPVVICLMGDETCQKLEESRLQIGPSFPFEIFAPQNEEDGYTKTVCIGCATYGDNYEIQLLTVVQSSKPIDLIEANLEEATADVEPEVILDIFSETAVLNISLDQARKELLKVINQPPFLEAPPASQEYVVKLGKEIMQVITNDDEDDEFDFEEPSAPLEPKYEPVEQQLKFDFVISTALDDQNAMASLQIDAGALGEVKVEYQSDGSEKVVKQTKHLSYDLQSTVLNVQFEDESDLRKREGVNPISIELEDSGGKTASYIVSLKITVPEREAKIKPESTSDLTAEEEYSEMLSEDGLASEGSPESSQEEQTSKDGTSSPADSSDTTRIRFTKSELRFRYKLYKAMKDQRQDLSQFIVVEEKEKVMLKLRISEISRKGIVTIKPNQPIEVPPLKLLQSKKRRNLKSLDVSVDQIFDLQIKFENENPEVEIDYQLELQEWTSEHIKMNLNINEPLYISQGLENDKLNLTVRPESSVLFVGAESGLSLELRDIKLGGQLYIPKQLPDFISEAAIKQSALAGTGGLSFIAIINLRFCAFPISQFQPHPPQLVLSFILKSSINQIWSLFLIMQIMKELPQYMDYIPAHLDMVLAELKKFIDFEMLSPDSILKFIDEEWSVAYFLDMAFDSVSFQQDKLIPENILTLLFLLGIFALVITLMILVAVVAQRYKEKVKQKLNAIYDQMVFNGIIRSLTLSYMAQGLMLIQYAKMMHNSVGQVVISLVILAGLGIYMLAYPIGILIYLILIDKDSLEEEATQAKIGNLYSGVRIKNHKFSVLFYPVSMLRRFVFIVIVAGLFQYSLKLMFLCLSCQLYQLVYLAIRPHQDRLMIYVEVFNETILVLITYNMMLIANRSLDINLRFHLGTTLITLLSLLALINIYVTTSVTVKRLIAHRKKKLREEKLKALLEEKGAQQEEPKQLIEMKQSPNAPQSPSQAYPLERKNLQTKIDYISSSSEEEAIYMVEAKIRSEAIQKAQKPEADKPIEPKTEKKKKNKKKKDKKEAKKKKSDKKIIQGEPDQEPSDRQAKHGKRLKAGYDLATVSEVESAESEENIWGLKVK